MKILLFLSLLLFGCGAPQKVKVSKPSVKTIKLSDFSAARIIGGDFVRGYIPVTYWRENAIYEFKTTNNYCKFLRLGYSKSGELTEMTCKSPSMWRQDASDFLDGFLAESGSGSLKKEAAEAFHLEGIRGVTGRWNKTDSFTFRMLSGSNSVTPMVNAWFKTLATQRSFSQENLSRVFRFEHAKYAVCYERALRRNSAFISVKVVTRLSVDAAGNVVKVRIGSTPEAKPFTKCLGEHFWRLKFPGHTDEYFIKKVFIFKTST